MRSADKGDQDEHQQGQRQRHGDVAGEGEDVGPDAEQIAEQDEEEQREDEREEAAAFRADGVDAHRHHGLVGHLGGRLQAARHHRARAHAQPQQAEHQQAGDDHHQVGLGEIHRGAERPQRGMQLNWPSASID